MRLSVDIHKNGIFFGRIEVRGLEHPRVHNNVTDVELNEFCWLSDQRRHLLAQLLVVFEHAHDAMFGKLHEFGDWRCVEC